MKTKKTTVTVTPGYFYRPDAVSVKGQMCPGHTIVINHVSGLTANIELASETKKIVGVEFKATRGGKIREDVQTEPSKVETVVHTFYMHLPATGKSDLPISFSDAMEVICGILTHCKHDQGTCLAAAHLIAPDGI